MALVLEMSGSNSGSNETHELLMKQHVVLGVHKLDDLWTFNSKLLSTLSSTIEPVVVAALTKLAEFAKINSQEDVLDNLGIKPEKLTAETVKWVVDSYARKGDLVDATEEVKSIPQMNPQNAFVVHVEMEKVLNNQHLGFLLEQDKSRRDFEKGQNYFENRWLLKSLRGELSRTSSTHLLEGETFNGAKILEKMMELYLPQAKKEPMASANEESFSSKRIFRVDDVHGFFSVANWHRKILVHLKGKVEGNQKTDQMLATVLRAAKTMSQCQPALNTILAMLDSDAHDLDKVKTRMYNTWSQKCMSDRDKKNIAAFFPAYSQMLQFDRITQEVLDGKDPLPIQENSQHRQNIRKLSI